MKCYPKKQIVLVNVICDISPAYTPKPKGFLSPACAAAYAAARRLPASVIQMLVFVTLSCLFSRSWSGVTSARTYFLTAFLGALV